MCMGLAGLAGCQQEAAAPPATPIPEVAVITVTTQTVVDEPEFIGQTESSRPVEIRPQVTGIIKERLFQEGRDVKMGALLYQIDPVPFQAAAMSAKAMVAQAEARLVQAKQNHARVTPLLAEQAVSQKDVDDAVAEELAAKAALEGAKAQLVKAQFDLDNTRITAPIAGLIERTRVYEGRLVSAQTDLLTVIHQVDPMYVTVSVPEPFLLKRLRERTLKRVQGAGVYELRGVITFVDGTVYPQEGRLDSAGCGTAHRDRDPRRAGGLPQSRAGRDSGGACVVAGTVRQGSVRGFGSHRSRAGPAAGGPGRSGGTRGVCRRDGRKGRASPRPSHKLAS